jgi:hypothetical protein
VGYMQRARQESGAGTSGPWAPKEKWLAEQTLFYVSGLDFDPHGSREYPGARWIFTCVPFHPSTGDFESGTKFELKSNEYRAQVLGQLQRILVESEEAIGPFVLIKNRTKDGKQRFYDVADAEWDEETGVITVAEGAERPESNGSAPAAPAPVQQTLRQTIGAPATGEIDAPPAPVAAPPVAPAAKKAPGRPKKAAPAPVTPVAAPAAVTAEPAGSSSPGRPAEAPKAAAASTVTLTMGQATCEACGKIEEGRVFEGPPEMGKVIIHACSATGKQVTLKVLEGTERA